MNLFQHTLRNNIRRFHRSITSASRLRGFEAPTVWQEFTPLAVSLGSVNLGQGFPDWDTPDFVKKSLSNAVNSNHNQYCRSAGDPELVETLAKHYSPLVGREINGLTEITTSVGATEALYALMQATINDGDEVVTLEPAFDVYPAQVQMAGGICKYVSLEYSSETSKWELDMNKLEQSITSKTKLLLLNTPHNPTGKVFSKEELSDIADILHRNPHVTAICDEVYEKLVYDHKQHIRLASLPGMWDRVVTVSSVGKTFSCTGWKVGWAYGSEELIKPITLANQWIQYCVSTPTCRAVAEIIRESDSPYEGHASYYDYVCNSYQQKRDHLVETLRGANLNPIVPEGGFFVIADTSAYNPTQEHFDLPGPDGSTPVSRDWAFARWLSHTAGVTPIPPSAFYTPETKGQAATYARFAFCKTDSSLEEARKRLLALANHQN
jgi:kynurenine---oxoglutarate transaminase / cysteine-S-conjugate beta-lyase / glutamine---phenylpyruvate transaminase